MKTCLHAPTAMIEAPPPATMMTAAARDPGQPDAEDMAIDATS